MTFSERAASSLHARKQVEDEHHAPRLIRSDGAERPALRLVAPPMQVLDTPPQTVGDHSPLSHSGALTDSLNGHTAASTHPPTVAEAARAIWVQRDQVRHGLAGQLGSAAAGLAQTAGLAACWGAAHVLFASKSRAAISAAVLLAVFVAVAIASNA